MNTNNITYRGVHMKEKKKKNTTKYGEFVCSAYHWLPIEKQKENADKLANITQKSNKEKNKYYDYY